MKIIDFINAHTFSAIKDFSIFVPFLIALRKSKHLDLALRFFFVFLSLNLLLNIASVIMGSYKVNNLLLYNLLLPFQLLFLLKMFKVLLSKDYQKKALNIIFIIFVLFFILDFFTSNPNFGDLHNHRSNKYSFALYDMIIIGVILYYFYRILIEISVPNLYAFPMFWICCGLLLYHAGTVFIHIFSFETNVWGNGLLLGELIKLPIVLAFFEYLFFATGLWLVKQDSIH